MTVDCIAILTGVFGYQSVSYIRIIYGYKSKCNTFTFLYQNILYLKQNTYMKEHCDFKNPKYNSIHFSTSPAAEPNGHKWCYSSIQRPTNNWHA